MSDKIKVLWLSGAHFNNEKPNATGTWMHAMAHELLNTGRVELYNITQTTTNNPKREDYFSINQWAIPANKLNRKGLPSKSIVKYIQQVVSEIKPDIIHVWGTENYWGLLTARKLITGRVLLEIQGLKYETKRYFYAGLTIQELISTLGIREILKPSDSVFSMRRSFKDWGKLEKEIIRNHNLITTQSNWVRSHVREINGSATLFKTKMVLRDEFIHTKRWSLDDCFPFTVFTTFSSIVSYKGLHVLIKAIGVLKKEFPNIKLTIAGSTGRKGILEYGYFKWIKRAILKLNIPENIHWVGALNASEIVDYLQKSNVAVVPSFIESYCMALDEALHVGTPTAASFAGAMPELGVHKETVYYYQSNDHIMLADAIRSFFIDKDFAEKVSINAYNSKRLSVSKADIQLDIYTEVLNN